MSQKYNICQFILFIALVFQLLFSDKVLAQALMQKPDTALLQAITEKNTEAALLALNAGANPNAKDKKTGLVALQLFFDEQYDPEQHELIYPKDDSRLVQALLAKGAYLKVRDKGGYTPLLNAVHYGLPKVVNLLLDQGAKLNVQSNLGETCIMMAASSGDIEMIKLLIQRGANPNSVDRNGAPALLYAVANGSAQTVKYLIDLGLPVKNRKKWIEKALKTAITATDYDGALFQASEKRMILQKVRIE